MIKIRKNKQLEKNIRQNLKLFRDPVQEAGEVAQGMFHKITMIVLAISTAVFSILGTLNILFRVPDFFRFEFDRTEVSGQLDLSITGTELGSFFSKFMLHGGEFSLEADYEGIKRELFTGVEANMMENFRLLLDIMLIVAVITFILTIACIVILYMGRLARGLRRALNIGLGIYIAAMAALTVYFNVYDGDIVLKDAMTNGRIGPDDLLQQMFDGRFTLDITVATFAISFIIMMIVRYIVWRMTAQKGMFSEGLKGVAE